MEKYHLAYPSLVIFCLAEEAIVRSTMQRFPSELEAVADELWALEFRALSIRKTMDCIRGGTDRVWALVEAFYAAVALRASKRHPGQRRY